MLVAITAAGLLGCGKRSASSRRAVQVLQDQRYGPGPFQTYDLYRRGSGRDKAVVVIVHYGGGVEGDKADYTPAMLGTRLVNEGFSAASINYRLAPAYVWPAAVEDVRAAIRHFKERDGKVFVVGLSAGGWFAEQAALTPSTAPAGIVSVAAPQDMTVNTPWSRVVLAGVDRKRASPIFNVKKGFPPTLLIQGTQDLVVPLQQAVRMRDALKREGVEVELVVLRGAGHFQPEPQFLDAFYPHLRSWLQEHAGARKASPKRRDGSGAGA
jgi:acetyl esterase/lipase